MPAPERTAVNGPGPGQGAPASGGLGRTACPPHPLLRELLYDPRFEEDRRTVLPWLLRIDAAHLVMLTERRLLPREITGDLLRVNRELAARLEAGEPVLAPGELHRGLYLVYERHYVERLGDERGGAAHVARSRNDINATATRMRLRCLLLDLLEDGTLLLAELAAQADRHATTLMSAFTHLQPAQPSTLGHYLAGVAAEQLRAVEALARSFALVDRSPMGAAAGIGTSFDLDAGRVAALLGFAQVIENSADAVASRDYAAYVLSGAAILGVSLTRLALDLQTWASQAYGFLDWPDELVSTSSIMPQKRNAFVLEDIRGQAIHPVGALVNTLMGMKNTPFSNSVEVGGEAISHLWPALAAIRTAIRLTRLTLAHLVANPERMRAALEQGQAAMTSLANLLVTRHGLAFRSAHESVARLVQDLDGSGVPSPLAIKTRLEAILREAPGVAIALDPAEIARAVDPAACVAAASHGGGPAPEQVRRQLRALDERTRRLAARVAGWRRRLRDADVSLAAAAAAVVRGEVASPAAPAGPTVLAGSLTRASSVLDLMRDTPLLALRGRALARPRARLWAKLEGWLPGAMKDRVALAIVERAEARGELRPGGLIVESSSGTMAEGLARVGAIKGYRVIIVSDPRIDDLTRSKLAALGATLEVVEDYHPKGGWQVSRLERLRQVIADHPGAFWTRQYDNPDNAGAYEATMAGELLAALGSTLTTLVGTVGSGGSLCGTARALRRELPGLRVIAVDAVGSALFNQPDRKRLQSGHGNSVIPGNLDYGAVDEVHWVGDAEAFNACRELARREGVFAGGSSGAAYVVASWAAEQAGAGEDVVVLLPDRGDRYFSTVYSDGYCDAHGVSGREAAGAPELIRYGVDVAERWSRAVLPHGGSPPYHSPEVLRTRELAAELGMP